MYDCYMGKVLLPIAPSKLQIKIGNANKTVTLINDGEINILKTPKLTDIDYEIVLPHEKYDFAKYKKGFKKIEYFLEQFEKWKVKKKPFQFIVTRQLPNGKSLYGTNIKVSLEDYTIKEDVDDNFDTVVSIKLKQYRDYGTKVCKIDTSKNKPKTTVENQRPVSDNAPAKKTYTVVKGDCLWKIAATHLGNGSRWKEIYELNKSVIGGNPNLIYPGQVFTLP